MRFYAILSSLLLLVSFLAHAGEKTLACTDVNTKAPLPYSVVKVTSPGKAAQYFIELNADKSVRSELQSAGSGDEDYLDYNAEPSAASNYGLTGGSIELHFKWANLTNTDGQVAADCK